MEENRIYFVDDELSGEAQIKVIGVGGRVAMQSTT